MSWLVLIFIAIVTITIFLGVAKADAIKRAKEACGLSLEQLTKQPTNSLFRKSALDAGRAYSNLTRNNKGVTVFDEVTLMNDINAACGGAPQVNSNQNQIEFGAELGDRLSRNPPNLAAPRISTASDS